MDRFTYKIYQNAINQGLIKEKDKILISISGGVDSVCLFLVLNNIKSRLNLTLHLVHFHHGIREESDREEAFVTTLSREHKVSLSVFRSNEFANKNGIQDKARFWRRQKLLRLREKLQFNSIALGHHRDDLVETQLWKIMRGCSLFSLTGIKGKNGPFIRPFLQITKEELQQYMKNQNQEWCEDSSNKSLDYTRNKIRQRILPLMEEFAGNKLKDKMSFLASDALLLQQLFEEIVPEKTYSGDCLNFAAIAKLPTLFANETIHRFLIFHGQTEMTRNNIEKIVRLVHQKKGNWSIALKKGKKIVGKEGTLFIQ